MLENVKVSLSQVLDQAKKNVKKSIQTHPKTEGEKAETIVLAIDGSRLPQG